MSAKKKGKERLAELEGQIKARGVQLSYEKLQFAGLRLKSGLCWFKGRYYLFVDKGKPVSECIELLDNALEELERLEAQGGRPPEEPAGEEPRGA
ncbi:MAG: hypothetical protein C4525_12040 [Desulfarculus sp.]|nr:MAG: hypothetical protein C4525_12040 [Desulfarculus sp.]